MTIQCKCFVLVEYFAWIACNVRNRTKIRFRPKLPKIIHRCRRRNRIAWKAYHRPTMTYCRLYPCVYTDTRHTPHAHAHAHSGTCTAFSNPCSLHGKPIGIIWTKVDGLWDALGIVQSTVARWAKNVHFPIPPAAPAMLHKHQCGRIIYNLVCVCRMNVRVTWGGCTQLEYYTYWIKHVCMSSSPPQFSRLRAVHVLYVQPSLGHDQRFTSAFRMTRGRGSAFDLWAKIGCATFQSFAHRGKHKPVLGCMAWKYGKSPISSDRISRLSCFFFFKIIKLEDVVLASFPLNPFAFLRSQQCPTNRTGNRPIILDKANAASIKRIHSVANAHPYTHRARAIHTSA